jgi:hypothetical protein
VRSLDGMATSRLDRIATALAALGTRPDVRMSDAA